MRRFAARYVRRERTDSTDPSSEPTAEAKVEIKIELEKDQHGGVR